MAITIPEDQFDDLLAQFGLRAFHTHDFIQLLARQYPQTWKALESHYGRGGKGAKKHYSAYSRVSHVLDFWSKRRRLDKLEYQKAASELDWGSPVIRYWAKDRLRIEGQLFPDEVVPGVKVFDEGGVTTVLVNKYERDPAARKECIAHYGAICAACGFDFGERYGERGKGFIHVHHRVRVSKPGKSHKVDPIKHLIPVCPNCHAMLHTVQDDMSVEALTELIRARASPPKLR